MVELLYKQIDVMFKNERILVLTIKWNIIIIIKFE